MRFDTAVRGGQVWYQGGLATVDLAISGGAIAAIGADPGPADVDIDAEGLLVLPGAIDVHTHFDTDVGGQATADTYESGTRAAAFGGITAVINYAFQTPGERLRDVIERERARADGHAHVDYGFHIVVTDPTAPHFDDDLTRLAEWGCPSIKLFTALDFRLSDADILHVMAALADRHTLVNTHAEDGALVDHLTDRLLADGRTGIEQLGPSRPPLAEALATERMIGYAHATGCPLYIVHLSCEQAIDAVRRGRAAGAEVYVETRPAYLYLDETAYTAPGDEGKKYACWPPLRSEHDQAVLWDALATGEIQCYATDHTTWTLVQKIAPGLTFDQVPGGMSNVQTSIGMLYSEGVVKGKLTLERFVKVTAENPAKLFGLWPRKGQLHVGSDADIMLFDPNRDFTVHAQMMQSRSDFDPYEGYTSAGWPVATMCHGTVVAQNEALRVEKPRGEFLHRQPFNRPRLG